MITTDLHATRWYEVRHRTSYFYEDYVTASYGRACLRPRASANQHVLSNVVEVKPAADVLTEHTDLFGNYSHYIEVRTRHTELRVSKTSVVAVTVPAVDLPALNEWTVASAARELRESPLTPRATYAAYTLPSSLVELTPAVRGYATSILHPDRPLGDALADLYHRVYTDFQYKKGATGVSTTLDEVLADRRGVCQDFAHLAAGALRAAGLPGRYVSGYIETAAPPGKPKLEGSDATHAWVAAMVPGGDWIDLDPTNDHFADSRYVTTAWGRDFRDVSPLRGVIYTESKTSTLEVLVDVIPLDPATLPPQLLSASV